MWDKWKWGAIAIIVAGAWGWWADRDARLRAEGRAEVAEAVAEARADTIADQDVVIADLRSTADAASARADSVEAEAAREIQRERARRPTVVERVVRDAGADSAVVRAAVMEVSATYELEISALQRATATVMADRDAIRNERDALRVTVAARDALIESLRDASRARVRADQGWVSRNIERIGWVAGGIAIGAIGMEIVR